MPNIKSAKKRVLVNAKKNQINRSHSTALKTAIKKFNNAIDTLNLDEATALLPETYSIIDMCCTKGILHKNNAANKKSRLAKRLSDVKSGKLAIVIKKDNRTIAAEKAKLAIEARAKAKEEFQKKAAEQKAEKLRIQQEKLAAEAEAAKKAPKAKKATAKKDVAETTTATEKKPAAKKAPAKKAAASETEATEKKPAAKKAPAKKAAAKVEEVKAEEKVEETKTEESAE